MNLIPKLVCILAGAALAAVPATAADAPSLDAALKTQAAKVLAYAQAHECHNVAVLKFLVKNGDGAPTDDAGELNMSLTRRLTVALVLALPNEDIGIVSNANEVLFKGGASYMDEDGRAKCFRGRGFVLAWGDPQLPVKPDLFVVGCAMLSKDLKQTTVRVQAFAKDGKLNDIDEFIVPTNVRTLVDTGHSFLMTPKTHPKLFDGSRGAPEDELDAPAVDLSQKYSAQLKDGTLPSFEADAPVRVIVYYGDDAVPVKDGEVREPKEGEKLWFKLENVTDDTYGVVLKINGENSIFRERLDDRDCHKWILKPHASVVVRGFQMKLTEREDFKVLTPEASKTNEVRYGEHAGTFHISAFKAKSDKKPDPPVPAPPVTPTVKEEEQQAVAAIARGTLKIEGIQPADLKSLQRQLRQHQKDAAGSRGMVDSDSDNPKPHKVEKITFQPDPPIPVMAYRIRYYKPAGVK